MPIYTHNLFTNHLYDDVYNFLRRVSQKGIIEFDDLIRPLPKMYIAEKLLETDSLSSQLTSLEREELKFFLQSYYFEKWFIENDNKRNEYMEWFNDDPARTDGEYSVMAEMDLS